MKKFLLSIVAFFIVAWSVSAAVPMSESPLPANSIARGKFKKISLKDYKIATGRKMPITHQIAFKAAQKKLAKNENKEGKSQVVALLLVLLVGALGIHRFYLGYTWQGIVQLITFGGFGVWALIDLVRIVTGDLQPKNGKYTTTLE